jgi:hypothetical protein
MPRKRQIDPKFWLNGDISKISDRAKLLYIGLWNFADDNGTIENNPNEIRAAVFPYNSQIKVEKYLEELIKIKKIIPYEAEGKNFLWIKNFLRHQKIDYPSYKNPLSENIRREIARIQRGLATNRESRVEKNRIEKNRVEDTSLNKFLKDKKEELAEKKKFPT